MQKKSKFGRDLTCQIWDLIIRLITESANTIFFLDALASLETMLDIQSLMFSRFHSIREYYRVLQSVTECYRMLQSVIEHF